jgi:hypothetical protein
MYNQSIITANIQRFIFRDKKPPKSLLERSGSNAIVVKTKPSSAFFYIVPVFADIGFTQQTRNFIIDPKP